MRRNRLFLLLTAFALLISVLIGWEYRAWRDPHAVAMQEVERMEVRSAGETQGRVLPAREARQVLRWFNSATNIVNNPEHQAPKCANQSRLTILLRSGERVVVTSSQRVTRQKEPQSGDYPDYFIKQADLEAYLRNLDQKAGRGC